MLKLMLFWCCRPSGHHRQDLQHRDPASPPHPGATGVASHLRGVGGAQSYAMAEEVRGAKRQSGVLDEGDASG